MPKIEGHPIIRAQALPSTAAPERARDLWALLEVEQTEVLSRRSDFLFEPWFRSLQVAREIRRLQTVPEKRKWTAYYERYGCISCHRKRPAHQSNGMCVTCRVRIHGRLKTVIRHLSNEAEPEPTQITNLEQIARQAIAADAHNLLPATFESAQSEKGCKEAVRRAQNAILEGEAVKKKEPCAEISVARYLQATSVRSLEGFEMARLGEAANLRKDLIELLDQLVDALAEARLARTFIEQRRKKRADAHVEVTELLPPGRVTGKQLKGA